MTRVAAISYLIFLLPKLRYGALQKLNNRQYAPLLPAFCLLKVDQSTVFDAAGKGSSRKFDIDNQNVAAQASYKLIEPLLKKIKIIRANQLKLCIHALFTPCNHVL
jgi:hypothetical protein